jgi:hypothetical protein
VYSIVLLYFYYNSIDTAFNKSKELFFRTKKDVLLFTLGIIFITILLVILTSNEEKKEEEVLLFVC